MIFFRKGLDLVGDPPFILADVMIDLNQISKDYLNNNQSPKNAISHKDLQVFLINAKKDITTFDTTDTNNKTEEEKKFYDLIKNWTETSQKILLTMNSKDEFFSKNKNSKTLMAFGAMGAHINMALQALKATECDQ